MERGGTPAGGGAPFKTHLGDRADVATEALEQARSVLRQARQVAGRAAHKYFFRDATRDAYDAYLVALEAEVDAELHLADVAAEHH